MALIKFKAAPLSKKLLREDMMWADNRITKRSFYVDLAQKTVSFESPVPKDSSSAYITGVTGSLLT